MTVYEVEFGGARYINRLSRAWFESTHLYVEVVNHRADDPGDVEKATFRRTICQSVGDADWHQVIDGVAELGHIGAGIAPYFDAAAAGLPRCECFNCRTKRPEPPAVSTECGDQYVLEVES